MSLLIKMLYVTLFHLIFQLRKRMLLEGKSYLALAFSQVPKKPCSDEPSESGQSLANNFTVDPVFEAAYRGREREAEVIGFSSSSEHEEGQVPPRGSMFEEEEEEEEDRIEIPEVPDSPDAPTTGAIAKMGK